MICDVPAEVRYEAITKIAQQDYVVMKGDTLSSLATRNGTTVKELQTLNKLTNPNALSIGQKLKIPARPVKRLSAPATTSNINSVSNALHSVFNNSNLEAAILANIDRETGGKFDHTIWQNNKKQVFDTSKKQTGGYGLFQLTGKNLTDYKNWLVANKLSDSAQSQINFMSKVYGPTRSGWKANIKPSSGMTTEQYADWWHKKVETPGHVIRSSPYYSQSAVQKATDRHNDFMKTKIRLRKGVWVDTTVPVR